MNEFLQLTRQAFRISFDLEKPSPAQPNAVLLERAHRHRTISLWANAFNIPQKWRSLAYGQILHSTRMETEAVRISTALEAEGTQPRLIKGPALAIQAWPRPELRNFDDLDFRCAKGSLDALTTAMTGLGYRPKTEDRCRREDLWHFGWGIAFQHNQGPIVEFNHRMFPPQYPWPDKPMRRPDLYTSVSMSKSEIKSPAPALHLLLACSHAAWHAWGRLGWMVDIAGLLVQHKKAYHTAKQIVRPHCFAIRALETGCALADRIFGPLPNRANEPQQRSCHVHDPSKQALQHLMQPDPVMPARRVREEHYRLMRPGEIARYTLRRATIPGDPDFRRWRLSQNFRCLYWVLRPARIVAEAVCQGIRPTQMRNSAQ